MIADRWGFCESHFDIIPEGQPVYENDNGLRTCEACNELYKKRAERKERAESGAVTSKKATETDKRAA